MPWGISRTISSLLCCTIISLLCTIYIFQFGGFLSYNAMYN